MGFFSRLKQAFRRDPAPAPAPSMPVVQASTSQITAGTTDYLVRGFTEKIEPAIRTGFEKLGVMLVDEIRASERRTKKELIEYFEGAFSNRAPGAARRITKEDVLEEFEKVGVRKLQDLKKILNANSSAIINHLKRLEKDGAVERTGYGEYRKIDRDFNVSFESSKKDAEIIKALNRLSRKKKVSYNF